MRGRLLALALAASVAAPAHAAEPPLASGVSERVAALSHAPGRPLYWLGFHWRGLTLIAVETLPDHGPIDLLYADCTLQQLNVFSLECGRSVDLEDTAPGAGARSNQGSCLFSATVRGATAAVLTVAESRLSVFTPGATIVLGSRTRATELAAAGGLRGLNLKLDANQPLPALEITDRLPPCHQAATAPQTAKQGYEARMQESFFVELAGSQVELPTSFASPFPPPSPQINVAARIRALLKTLEPLGPTLANMATRIARIQPPAEVAGLHRALVAELRAYDRELERAATLLQGGAWKDAAAWATTAAALNASIGREIHAIFETTAAFHRRGYTIYLKPSDD